MFTNRLLGAQGNDCLLEAMIKVWVLIDRLLVHELCVLSCLEQCEHLTGFFADLVPFAVSDFVPCVNHTLVIFGITAIRHSIDKLLKIMLIGFGQHDRTLVVHISEVVSHATRILSQLSLRLSRSSWSDTAFHAANRVRFIGARDRMTVAHVRFVRTGSGDG